MNRVTALVAEDEAPQRAALVALLQRLWPEIHIVAECADGSAALAALAAHAPDVAFLDIRLPGPSGLDLARAAPARTHHVFITAYDEYAVRAFEAGAVDYVLKPVDATRLARTLERLRERLAAARPLPLQRLFEALDESRAAAREPLRWITASLGDTVRLIAVDEVLYFQAQEKLTRVVTAEREALIRMSLRELMSQLDPQAFWQIHRATIVRAGAIDRVQRDELGRVRLWLRHGPAHPLPVSERFQGRFRGM